MTEIPDRSRRRFVAATAVAAVGGIAGCIGTDGPGAGDGDDGAADGGPTDGGTDGGPTDGGTDGGTGNGTRDQRTAANTVRVAERSPEEVVRRMLRASADGDRETVRRLTVEGHSLRSVGQVERVTIESVERYTAGGYADREGVSVSAVEDALTEATNRGYDGATVVSYTIRNAEYGEIQRDYVLVLDGDQWLMYDFGKLPE